MLGRSQTPGLPFVLLHILQNYACYAHSMLCTFCQYSNKLMNKYSACAEWLSNRGGLLIEHWDGLVDGLWDCPTGWHSRMACQIRWLLAQVLHCRIFAGRTLNHPHLFTWRLLCSIIVIVSALLATRLLRDGRCDGEGNMLLAIS